MSSKLYRFIKLSFFILFFISFISLRLNTQHLDARMKGVASDIALATADRSIQDTPGSIIKNYAQKCIDITSNVNQKLAIQALASQLYLNNLVIRFDESKKKYINTVGEMKSLTDAIEVGLVDLSKDVQQATETEQKLIQEADEILEYQYSLNEQAASVVDLMLSAPVKQRDISLDLDFEFLDDEIKERVNKYNIFFKEGFNPVSEFYTDEIDDLLGYVPGDPYATKTALIASQRWSEWPNLFSVYSTSWHPIEGKYVAITGEYDALAIPQPIYHLTIYDFDGTSLSNPVYPTGTLGGYGQYRSIDWSPDGGYLVAGGSSNSADDDSIRIFTFNEGPPKTVMQLVADKYDPSFTYTVTSVAWRRWDWDPVKGVFFAVVGDGDDAVDEIQIYKLIDSSSVTLGLFYSTSWGIGENQVYSCGWSEDGDYLAVAGRNDDNPQVLRVFKFDSDSPDPEKRLVEVASMNYDQFDFDVDWISGVDWSPNGGQYQYLVLSSNSLFTSYDGESPQIAMNAVGKAFAVWKNRSSGVIQALRYDGLTDLWQKEAVSLSSSTYESLEPQVAINNDGNAIAVWKRDDGGGSFTIQANRYDARIGSWQSPSAVTNLSLSGQNASLPQIAMDELGNANVVWQRSTGNSGEMVIQANRYDGFSWQDPSNVTNLSDVNEESEKSQIAMSDEGDAIVVWRKSDGGGSYTIQACKYDYSFSDWVSRVNVSSSLLSTFTLDNPQVAMSNDVAIIIWEGEEITSASYASYIPTFSISSIVQTRVNIISKGWGNQDAWEPSLNKEPEELSLSKDIKFQNPGMKINPQIAISDYEGMAVWIYLSDLDHPIFPGLRYTVQAKKYILGKGWQSTRSISPIAIHEQRCPQIAMDGAGNAIAVWGFSTRPTSNRYNAATDLWQRSQRIFDYWAGDLPRIAMDQAGNAIVVWQDVGYEWWEPTRYIYASRYNELTGSWSINLGEVVGQYSLKIVKFDNSSEALTFFTAWNNVEEMRLKYGVTMAKWAPSGEAVGISSERVKINGMFYNLIIFEVDFLSKIITLAEGNADYGTGPPELDNDLAWRPDGKYMSGVTNTGSHTALDVYDLDENYFTAVINTYDTSLPTKSEMKWPNKGERDIGILSNILCQNQEKDCTKSMPVKFAIPDGYDGAAGFVDIINPACTSADYGLTAVLDASVEVTDSLLGARKRNYKFMQDNLKLSKRLTDVYKKSIEMKKTEQARIIDQPGVYTFNKDVQGVIVIDADNITLDLNGYKIFSDSKIPITVNKNIKNINIKNGSIIGGNQYLGAPSGVLVKEGAQHITLENLTITFCYEGVTFKGEQDCSVTDCLVEDCAFKSNIKAASLDCSEYVTFKECEFLDCFLESVNLENNNKNCCQ